jgi:lipid-A-disaccharide synthase-like uncharacterized protein
MGGFGEEIRQIGLWWLVFGLIGQFAFTSRFIVQWIISERKGKSVMPIFFWYLSLVGATILLVYFIKRRDPVGMIGQSVGWLVYVRNIMLARREPNKPLEE